MRLTEKERLVLAAYELRANAPANEIAKATGLKDHSIRYTLNSLLSRRIIFPAPLISAQALGLTIYSINFSISAKRKTEREALIRALMKQKEVVRLRIVGGEFQYGMTMVAPHIGVIASILKNISDDYHKVFNNKAFSAQLSTTLYNRKYLTSKNIKTTSLTTKHTGKIIDVDEIDNAILSEMCSYPGLSHRQLAQQLKLSHSSFEARIKKLEKQEIIRGYLYVPDIARIGVQGFRVLIYAKGIERSLSNELHKFCESHPDIIYITECLGNWDYEIGFELEKAIQVSEAIQELYDKFGYAINGIRVLTKFKDLKNRWYFSR